MGSAYQFHSWRVFVLVCAFPCVAAIAALNSMPESPRFYLEVSRCSAVTCVIYRRVEDRKPLIWRLWVGYCFSTQNGKHDEGWMILKQVHDTNMRAKGYPERVFSVSLCEDMHQNWRFKNPVNLKADKWEVTSTCMAVDIIGFQL